MDKVFCTNCKEQRLAQSLCPYCNKWLCLICTDIHHHAKDSKMNVLSETDRKQPNTGRSQELLYCQRHNEEPLRLFCETCAMLTCSSCHLSSHKNHSLFHVGKAIQNQQRLFESLTAQVEDKKATMKSATKQIESRLHDIKVMRRTTENQIKMAKMIMLNEINKRANVLLEQLERIMDHYKLSLEYQQHRIVDLCQQLEQVQNFINWATAHDKTIPFLYSKELLSFQMQCLHESQHHANMSPANRISFYWDASFWTKQISLFGQLTTDTAHQGYPDNANIQRPQPLICQGLPAALHHRPVDQANEFQPCFQQPIPAHCGQCHHRSQALQEHLAQRCMHLTETDRGHRLQQQNPTGQHELEQGRRYRRIMPYPVKTLHPWKVPQQAQFEQDQQAGMCMGTHLQMKQLEQYAYPVSCTLPSHSIHQQMHLQRASPTMQAPQTHMTQQQPAVQLNHLQPMQLLQQRQMQTTEPLLLDHAMQHGVLQPSQLEQMQKGPKDLLQSQESKLQLRHPAKPQQFQQARVKQINYIVRQQPVQSQNGMQQQSFQPALDNGQAQQIEQLQQEAELQQHDENHRMTHASVVNQIIPQQTPCSEAMNGVPFIPAHPHDSHGSVLTCTLSLPSHSASTVSKQNTEDCASAIADRDPASQKMAMPANQPLSLTPKITDLISEKRALENTQQDSTPFPRPETHSFPEDLHSGTHDNLATHNRDQGSMEFKEGDHVLTKARIKKDGENTLDEPINLSCNERQLFGSAGLRFAPVTAGSIFEGEDNKMNGNTSQNNIREPKNLMVPFVKLERLKICPGAGQLPVFKLQPDCSQMGNSYFILMEVKNETPAAAEQTALFDDTVHPPQTNHLQSQDDPNQKPLDTSDLHRLAQSCDSKDPEPAPLCGDKEEPPCTNLPEEMEEASVMENEDFCAVCLNGGDLLCCDQCPKVFHLSCHVPSLLSFPVGEWVCSLCRNLQIPEMIYDCENTRLIQEHKGKRPQYGLSLYDQRKCEKLTLHIYCNTLSLPFHEPVSPLARHYYQIIKKPIDLSVIRSKLNKRSPLCYYTPDEFVADVFLMFRNCAKFNYPDSEVAQAGRSLEAFFNEKLKEVFPDKAFQDLMDDSDPEEFDVYKVGMNGFLWPPKEKESCHIKRRRRNCRLRKTSGLIKDTAEYKLSGSDGNPH
ncbi:tripartite motif-containing protein 66-like isoform X2 [Polyodon spathula]|uniref:tripartite motif-containing protein 66-like isoform X2 n=1 Tax=Polyodon spathula TaxID=7913 RepID=UPI001B7F333C|nr:tripartite motif-containing protein 66-like isoform X2 [Polyodon spathula]